MVAGGWGGEYKRYIRTDDLSKTPIQRLSSRKTARKLIFSIYSKDVLSVFLYSYMRYALYAQRERFRDILINRRPARFDFVPTETIITFGSLSCFRNVKKTIDICFYRIKRHHHNNNNVRLLKNGQKYKWSY